MAGSMWGRLRLAIWGSGDASATEQQRRSTDVEHVGLPKGLLFGDAALADRIYGAAKLSTPALERARVAEEALRALREVIDAPPADPYGLWFDHEPDDPDPHYIELAALPSMASGYRVYTLLYEGPGDRNLRGNQQGNDENGDDEEEGADPQADAGAEAPEVKLIRVSWSCDPRFRRFDLAEAEFLTTDAHEVSGEYLDAYNATSIAMFERRGIPQQHELLPPPEVPRLRPLLKRLPEPVPSWSGWERRAGLTWPTMTSAIFAGQHPGGLVVACLGLRGGWKDDALTLLRQESERLLPGRHRWLLHDVGAADLVVLCGEWNWLACSLPMERERREELDGCLARLGLLRDLAVALMQGLAIPQPFPGAPLPPAPHPPQGAAEVAAAGRLLCTPRPLPRGRLPDSPGWFELPEDLLEHHANDLMGKLRWDRTAVKLSANIDRLAELSQGPKRP